MLADHRDSAVDRVALAYAPQVDDDPGPIEGHGPLFGVEDQVVEVGPGAGVGERRGIGDALGASEESPGDRQGASGDIVSSAGRFAERHRPFQKPEKAGLDDDRSQVGRGVELADFGVIAVHGELGFELFDDIQSLAREGDTAGSPRSEPDLEIRAHRRPARRDQLG